MAKYSFEFKKKVVLEYINGEGGTKYLSTKYGLGSNSQLRKWLAAYKKFGDEGLKRSRKKENYSFDHCFIFQGQFCHFCSIHRDREVEDNLPDPVTVRLLFRE